MTFQYFSGPVGTLMYQHRPAALVSLLSSVDVSQSEGHHWTLLCLSRIVRQTITRLSVMSSLSGANGSVCRVCLNLTQIPFKSYTINTHTHTNTKTGNEASYRHRTVDGVLMAPHQLSLWVRKWYESQKCHTRPTITFLASPPSH